MRKFYLLTVLLFSACSSQDTENDIPVFYVSAECIENIIISMNEEDDGWALKLEFSSEGLDKINKLNNNYVGEIVNIVFKHKAHGFQTISRVHEPIISNMQVDGVKSEMEAQNIKKAIIESKDECGISGV